MAAPMKPAIFGLSRSLVNSFRTFTRLSRQGLACHTGRKTISQGDTNNITRKSLKSSRNLLHYGAMGTLHVHVPCVRAQQVQAQPHCQYHYQWCMSHIRRVTTGLTDDTIRKEIDKLTESFMEAKELLDDARESMGTVYFNEDLEDADQAVDGTLKDYQALLSRLNEAQRQNVRRTIGLKMEELSAHKEMIRDLLKD